MLSWAQGLGFHGPYLDGVGYDSAYLHHNMAVLYSIWPLQKDTESAMAKHSGAHLDLSAFSSPEVTSPVIVECACLSNSLLVSSALNEAQTRLKQLCIPTLSHCQFFLVC